MRIISAFLMLVFFVSAIPAIAQDTRTQYPHVLSKAYIGVDVGYINYKFSNAELNPGFKTENIGVPHTAVRITLFGYRFNKYLSAELNYMRPVLWVRYHDINGAPYDLPVYMNLATVVLKPRIPIGKNFSLNGEFGLAVVTRKGMDIDGTVVMNDASYVSVSVGGGFYYHLNKKWDIGLHASYSPSNHSVPQPATTFYSAGFKYNMHPLPEEVVKRNAESKYIFPRNLVQIGFATNEFGYGVNDFFSKGSVPVFWGGNAHVASGISVHYQRNIFHTRKVFSLDWGSSVSFWKSQQSDEKFFTFSLYPLLRFTLIRTKPLDVYLNYSVAGPSYISRTTIDSMQTGKQFTFQDFMGMGMYAGKKRKFNFEMRIAHYSNGNLFPDNDGVKVPLSFNVGLSF